VTHCWEDLLSEDERVVARGYAGPRTVRAGRALLLIDVYNRAFGPRRAPLAEAIEAEPSSCGAAAWDALPALTTLLATARSAALPVVHTVAGPGADLATQRTAGAPAADGRAEWGNRIVEPLAPAAGEVVLPKDRASAFFGTTLDSILRRAGVTSLVLAGETTSGCVRATAVDAHALGFDVVVVEDATFDRSPLSHKVSLFDLHLKYATVVDLDDACALLRFPGPVTLRALELEGPER
jgi:maleamate amidohydrolase